MTTDLTDQPATERQLACIIVLTAKRDYLGKIDGEPFETIHDVLGNQGNPDPKFVSKREASVAIDALLRCRPVTVVPGSIKFNDRITDELTQVLAALRPGKYALPRTTDPATWDFFEIREAKSGTRYVVQLLGSPGDWTRKKLDPRLQLVVARHVAEDPRAAMLAFVEHHRVCCGPNCGAKLSNPVSLALAIGPVCRKKLGL